MRIATGDRFVRALVVLALAAPCSARPAPDQVTLSARVDRTDIAEDERVVLEVRVEAPEPPARTHVPDDTDDFHVVDTGTRTESAVSLGGKAGVALEQAFVGRIELAPKRSGILKTPPIEVTVRGRLYVTPPVTVRVRPAGSAPPRSAPPALSEAEVEAARRPLYRGWEKDLVLQVELDRKEVFQGEQVVASIRLYSPVGVVSVTRFDPPSLDGFWSEPLEVPQSLQYQVRRVNGIPTRVYLLQRVALFPSRPGSLTLEPAALQALVRLGNGGGPLDPLADTVPAERRSRPVTLLVKPLPPGAPPGFQPAAVGVLQLAASTAPERAVAGEPVSVRLTASGDGNVRALTLPTLPTLPGARAYPPTVTDATGDQGGRFSGTRTVETVIVPERTGELEIPALEWPYFDPRAGRFAVARTAPIRLAVSAGAPAAASAAAPGTNALEAGLRPIRADGALERRRPPPWRSLPFALLLGLPPLLLAAVALGQRLGAARGAASARAPGRSAHHRLAAARRRLGRGERARFVAEVDRALVEYAAHRLGRPAAGLAREALLGALARAGAHPPAVRALAAALDATDLARYGGGAGGPELLAAAERALELLEEADWSAAVEVAP